MYVCKLKQLVNIKTIRSIFPVLGLTLLLLLAPCRVRNFIQEELGLTQTEVSNKNIATVNHSACSTVNTTETVFSNIKSLTQSSPLLTKNKVDFAFNAIDFKTNLASSYNTRNSSVSVVPLYILYQNLKVYLSFTFF